jgi:hypothetical protein
MALPTRPTIESLEISYLGQPCVRLEAKALNTSSLEISYLGQPFVGLPPGGGGAAFTLVCNPGAYAYSGKVATVKLERKVAGVKGVYTYTGTAATLTYSGGSGAYSLVCATGAYAYSGKVATVKLARKMVCATGAYAYSGEVATLTYVNHGAPSHQVGGGGGGPSKRQAAQAERIAAAAREKRRVADESRKKEIADLVSPPPAPVAAPDIPTTAVAISTQDIRRVTSLLNNLPDYPTEPEFDHEGHDEDVLLLM